MRLLLSAYACVPGMGSEPGVGWNWSRELARRGHEVVVLTVAAMADRIRAELEREAAPHPEFVFVDLAWWPKLPDGRWPRIMRLHYFVWQFLAARAARRLHLAEPFDCVHHITWGTIRLPTFMWLTGAPLIFGPLGGGEASPKHLRGSLAPAARLFEWVRDLSNATVRINPLMQMAFRKAQLVVARTDESARYITAAAKRTHIQQELAIADPSDIALARVERKVPANPVVVFAGRLIHWKGVGLALRAFARFRTTSPNARFVVCGEGPDRTALEALAAELGIADSVEFRAKLPQPDLFALFRRSSVLLFPSLHDSGGTVVLEALANGLPVVCLDCGGPKYFVDPHCGRIVATAGRDEEEIVVALSRALTEVLTSHATIAELSEQSFRRAEKLQLAEVVQQIYGKAGLAI